MVEVLEGVGWSGIGSHRMLCLVLRDLRGFFCFFFLLNEVALIGLNDSSTVLSYFSGWYSLLLSIDSQLKSSTSDILDLKALA